MSNLALGQVAHSLGKQDVAQTWLILKLLYCGNDIECSRLGLVQIKMPSRHAAGSRLSNVQVCQMYSVLMYSPVVFFHYGYFEQKHTSGLVDTFLTATRTGFVCS